MFGVPRKSSLFLFLLTLACSPALAHQSSVVYLDLGLQGREIELRFQIGNSDLYEAIGVDRDRAVTREEIEQNRGKLFDYLASHVTVKSGNFSCEPSPQKLEFADRNGFFFAVPTLAYDCKRVPTDVSIVYDLFFDVDPRHQAFLRVVTPIETTGGDEPREHVFRAADRTFKLTQKVTLFDHVRDYLHLGIEHIFTGYDHLSFLFGLLIIAGARSFRAGIRYVIGIVTAFTVAHSITLLCAGFGLFSLPSRFVEPAIALSIAYVAVENLINPAPRFRWLITFCFGLVHGFGFASVLRDIGLPASGLALSLLSFNVGVELGQLVVVALCFPILTLIARSKEGYDRFVRVGGSCVLASLATFWFFERVLGKVWLGGHLG